MRRRDPAEACAEAVEAAKRESQRRIRRRHHAHREYIESGRHVEVQILGDEHGPCCTSSNGTAQPSAVTRRCSRKAPAPPIAPGQRARPGGLCRRRGWPAKVGYVNAGTVEFLVKRRRRVLLPGDEHPTPGGALCHRADRVIQGGWVASSRCSCASPPAAAPLTQEDVNLVRARHRVAGLRRGHQHGFLPQPGPTGVVKWPEPPVRVDSALRSFDVGISQLRSDDRETDSARTHARAGRGRTRD